MRESKRMFESDLFERFSRIPPWQPPAIYLPLIVVLSAIGLGRKGIALPTFAALVLVGILAWTLMEYWLHRALFHYRPRTPFGRRLFWIMHGVHHDWPNDPLRLVFPPAVSIPLAIGFWMLFTRIAGDALRYPLMAGLLSGYLAYDMVHYWLHHATPTSRIGLRLRRYHLAHHHRDDGRGFGVSSPLWDYVFGSVP